MLKKTRKPFGTLRAFTLLELLVVISVIGLLASMLLPALSKARDKAREIKCMSRLKNLGQAMVMYANDWDDYLPGTGYVSASGGTIRIDEQPVRQLNPYVNAPDCTYARRDDGSRIWLCTTCTLPNGSSALRDAGYYFNKYKFEDSVVDGLSITKRIGKCTDVSKYFFFCCRSWSNGYRFHSGETSSTWVNAVGRRNALYIDGHVKSIERDGSIWYEDGAE